MQKLADKEISKGKPEAQAYYEYYVAEICEYVANMDAHGCIIESYHNDQFMKGAKVS